MYQAGEDALFVFSHLEAHMLVLVEHGTMHCLSVPLALLVLENVKEYLNYLLQAATAVSGCSAYRSFEAIALNSRLI